MHDGTFFFSSVVSYSKPGLLRGNEHGMNGTATQGAKPCCQICKQKRHKIQRKKSAAPVRRPSIDIVALSSRLTRLLRSLSLAWLGPVHVTHDLFRRRREQLHVACAHVVAVTLHCRLGSLGETGRYTAAFYYRIFETTPIYPFATRSTDTVG